MNNHLKNEIKKIEIPESLNERSKIGISDAEKQLKNDKRAFNLKIVRIVVGLLIIIGAFNVFQELFSKLGPQHIINDVAYVPNIETLSQTSSIIIKGTVLDETEPTNLNRNTEDPTKEGRKITPGTYHSVIIDEVLVGENVEMNDEIKVAVQGGSYKSVTSKIEADLKTDHSYIFFLNKSSQGYPYFYGAGEPYIFEIENDHIKAVSNLRYDKVFEDNNISIQAFYDKMNQSFNK